MLGLGLTLWVEVGLELYKLADAAGTVVSNSCGCNLCVTFRCCRCHARVSVRARYWDQKLSKATVPIRVKVYLLLLRSKRCPALRTVGMIALVHNHAFTAVVALYKLLEANRKLHLPSKPYA